MEAGAVDGASGERARIPRVAWRVALAILLLLGLAYGWQYAVTFPWHYDVVRTSASETVVRTLPDGTIATVGPGSELRFPEVMFAPEGHPHRKRSVWPAGDVTFQVPRLPRDEASGRPGGSSLSVETGHAWITAFDARFRVLALEGATQVEVEAGTVRVRKRSQSAGEPTAPAQDMGPGAVARITPKDVYIRRLRLTETH